MAENKRRARVVPFICKAAGARGDVNTPTSLSLSQMGPIPVRTGCAMYHIGHQNEARGR
jgi:hypothetical protein